MFQTHESHESKLMNRKVPLCIILCLIFWYSNMFSEVKWGSETSRSFAVPLGIKQGGINSPDFFACYYDGMVNQLRQMKMGCHIQNTFLASLFFADDIVLLAPTRSGLQKMINTCESYCSTFGLSFNAKKSNIMIFSKNIVDYSMVEPLTITGCSIDIVNHIKYLGVTITSGPAFSFSHEADLRSFYRSSNSILNQIQTKNETIQMHLLYSHCVPCFSYASAMKEFSSKQMNECNTALNDAIRKIFTFHRWESVRTLREGFGYPSLTEIFAKARKKFHESLPGHFNSTVSRLSKYMAADT